MLGGLTADAFKIFLSDVNVMAVLISAMIATAVLIIITDLFKRRF